MSIFPPHGHLISLRLTCLLFEVIPSFALPVTYSDILGTREFFSSQLFVKTCVLPFPLCVNDLEWSPVGTSYLFLSS